MTTLTTSTTPTSVRTGLTGGRILRGFARGLGAVAALVIGLGMTGSGYEAIAARSDATA